MDALAQLQRLTQSYKEGCFYSTYFLKEIYLIYKETQISPEIEETMLKLIVSVLTEEDYPLISMWPCFFFQEDASFCLKLQLMQMTQQANIALKKYKSFSQLAKPYISLDEYLYVVVRKAFTTCGPRPLESINPLFCNIWFDTFKDIPAFEPLFKAEMTAFQQLYSI